MNARSALGLVACAVVAVALWPTFLAHRVTGARAADIPTAAPVLRDYELRDKRIAFWEGAVREQHRNDMLSPRMLAGEYLQRYRERGDLGDVLRAQHMAQLSRKVQPRNMSATVTLAAVDLTLHRFREALAEIEQAEQYDPNGSAVLSQEASFAMELGEYARADGALRRITEEDRDDPQVAAVRARYDELTGHLAEGRSLLQTAMQNYDANTGAPAQGRAWFHFRAGELAFASGDATTAIRDEHDALAIFPNFAMADNALARFALATHRYKLARDAARNGAAITPLPETLGYEADAEYALGEHRTAAQTQDTIRAIERVGNAYHVSDRLISIYYAEHGIERDDALRIARREIKVRGDEIYAQDTLAWAAAVDGQWDEARRAMVRATRYDTEDARLQYHAGMIALHFGDRAEAKRRLERAISLNPHFHPRYADDARAVLARL